jgi:hypothetical protein
VTVVGVTGHRIIPLGARDFVATAVDDILRDTESPLDAFTSLAAGADQLVATAVLRAGGRLHVILPSCGYERTFDAREDLVRFRSLLEAADAVISLEYAEPSEEAFLAAGKSIVDHCDVLIAVWDGEPARGLGGTADVVGYARHTGKAVSVVWPDGIDR